MRSHIIEPKKQSVLVRSVMLKLKRKKTLQFWLYSHVIGATFFETLQTRPRILIIFCSFSHLSQHVNTRFVNAARIESTACVILQKFHARCSKTDSIWIPPQPFTKRIKAGVCLGTPLIHDEHTLNIKVSARCIRDSKDRKRLDEIKQACYQITFHLLDTSKLCNHERWL